MLCADLFKKVLDEKEFTYDAGVDSDGDDFVNFPYKGKTTRCFFSGDNGKYFSAYLVYERVPDDKFAAALLACNSLNVRFKWVTFYIDKDNDIMLHLDAILSPDNAGEEALELLIRMISIGDDAKPVIMKALYAD